MLHTNGHVPDIVFTDFKISNRSVSHKTPGSPLTTSIAYSRKIVLPTDVKIISFEFAALDFADPSKNQFACKMEGFDADWQYLGTTHSATYTNLAPGNYVFRVRGSNNDGVWNETGASIDIEILAPWWATWWAYILYGLVIGGILYTFYQLQAKRKQARAEAGRLKDLNDAKSQFLSTVSHELRTPLTSIMGFSKIIRKRLEERILPNLDRSDPKTDRAAEQVVSNLGIVISESERLTALINDVLDLAKIESGKIVWHEERLDVSDLIKRATAATATLFEQKNIPLQLNIEPGLPDTLGDPDRLLQVLVNLLSNAVKFTDAGAVTCSARLQNAHTLLMAVADTGVGVPEEFRQMIFEKFRQVTGDTLTDKPQGTGLGLAISKEIVEHHGGRIWLESAPGKGSVFCFTLPVR
jgi:signal transduction histidine kinase